MTHDYYDVLGVAEEATQEEIRRAYRDLAKVAMGDRPRFEVISRAFETLKDPSRRAAYDRQRLLGSLPVEENQVNGTAQRTEAEATVASGSDATVAWGGAAAAAPTVALVPGATIGFGGPVSPGLTPCPVCQTLPTPGEMFCLECGFLLGSTPGSPAPGRRALPRLRDADGREFRLQPGDNIVGREGADVMLPDRSVSRHHARIVVEESGAVWVEDLGSTNGTKAAGQRLTPNQRADLRDGMTLRFGAIDLTILVPPVAGPAAVAALPAPAAGPERTAMPVAALGAPVAPDRTMSASAARLVGKEGKVFVLASTNVTVGRKPENTIVLTGDSYVSGSHARIVYEENAFRVIDTGSTNGTRVNGRRLAPNAPEPLADGDEVVFGQTALTFRAPSVL